MNHSHNHSRIVRSPSTLSVIAFCIESHHSSPSVVFSAMRRLRNLLRSKSDKKTGQAAAAEDADDAVDDPLDDTALGLDVWVQGVNPIVE